MEITKSLKAYLYDKTASPLYATFIVSWCLWNWRIFYVTFFLSEDIVGNKLNYIDSNVIGWWVSLFFPLGSTFVLVTLMPWLSNKVTLLTNYYDRSIREEISEREKEIRLTISESIALRMDVDVERTRFATSMTSRDKDLAESRQLVKTLSEKINEYEALENGLRFLRAEWGVDGTFFDVKDKLNAMVKDDSITLKADASILGDPKPGVAKSLSVIYVRDGVYHYRILNEHSPQVLILNKQDSLAMDEMEKNTNRIKGQ